MKIKRLTAFVYDIETFPNVFTCAVKNTESGAIRVYEVSQRKNDLPELLQLFLNKNIIFVGYNNIHFDDPIINYIIIHYETLIAQPVWEITKELKRLGNTIIESNKEQFSEWSRYKHAHNFESLDLLTMLFSSKLRCSLKEMQVTMEYHNVREYEGDFNKSLPLSEIDNMIKYNINDINSTEELMKRCEEDIRLREAIEKKYGIVAMNKDGVNLGMEIIKEKYLEKVDIQWKVLRDMRSPCNQVCLRDIIFPFISFEKPELVDLLNDLKRQCLNIDDKSFERKFVIGGVMHTFSLGGLHSVNKPKIYMADDDYELADFDVESLYPTIIIEHGICPAHLDKKIFIDNYREIKEERIKAKRAGDKLTDKAYKLAINGITGNLQSEYSWCYDPKAALTIRINGQLMLCMLLERLDKIGVEIINSNTDGCFMKYHKSQKEALEKMIKEWESITKLHLAADYFERFYQFAINDYIGVKKGYNETHDPSLIKTKGLFIDKVALGKGMAPQIIAKALKDYFVDGVPVNDTLHNCLDIKQFLTYQKVKKEFHVEYAGKEIAHINRYYMSTNGYKLQRYALDPITGKKSKLTDLCSTSGVTIYNEFIDNFDVKNAHINYGYYRAEIYKIIYPLEDSLNPTLF